MIKKYLIVVPVTESAYNETLMNLLAKVLQGYRLGSVCILVARTKFETCEVEAANFLTTQMQKYCAVSSFPLFLDAPFIIKTGHDFSDTDVKKALNLINVPEHDTLIIVTDQSFAKKIPATYLVDVLKAEGVLSDIEMNLAVGQVAQVDCRYKIRKCITYANLPA